MEITQRELITAIHGMLFGGFFLMAIFGALVMLLERQRGDTVPVPYAARWQATYLAIMVALGWAAVLSGAYIIYPWYRAVAPPGVDLALYPKLLLTSRLSTAGWHTLGMEWKEYVAWIAPMAMTMVAFVMTRHRLAWNADCLVRRTVLGFALAGFLAAAIAGGWGALINKAAPVRGGRTMQIVRSGQ